MRYVSCSHKCYIYIFENEKGVNSKFTPFLSKEMCGRVSDYRTLIEDFVKVIEFMKYINFMGMV